MPNVATVFPNGPIHIKGALLIRGEEKDEVYLCRCGQSANKPFCDGSHKTSGFEDAAAFQASGEAGDDGPVTLTPYKDGPMGIKGPITVIDATGNAHHATKGALCRCGQSSTKPWCDGTHKTRGFQAE